jgi:hypothetical protein
MPETDQLPVAGPPSRARKWLKRGAWGCGGILLVMALLVAALFLLLNRVPKSYPAAVQPLAPPTTDDYARFELDGFESPYLGHTGSWNGKGGGMGGASKVNDLEKEVMMGLRWTFMAVYWRALEPDGPVDLSKGVPPAWKALDAFVIEAEKRKLNILMQGPVIGGNAGGPPAWAGRREAGKSAPQNIDAAADFAGKLVARYKPGGTLATEQGWEKRYGVRAWELDNEPEMYLTHWNGQAGDYAEFATKAAAKMKAEDPLAMVLLPGVASGKHKQTWLQDALDAQALNGSPAYRSNGVPHSIGPAADAVSFHVYEGMDSALSDTPRTIEVIWSEVRDIFENHEKQSAGFHYAPKREYWHTEGNFDFIGALSEKRRAAWRMQFFTRSFAAGIRKVCVMDASDLERIAVRTYTGALPWPFPMERADGMVKVVSGQAVVFRHQDGGGVSDGTVWVLWAVPGTGEAAVQVPIVQKEAISLAVDGAKNTLQMTNGSVSVTLAGDKKMAPPVLVVDRPRP